MGFRAFSFCFATILSIGGFACSDDDGRMFDDGGFDASTDEDGSVDAFVPLDVSMPMDTSPPRDTGIDAPEDSGTDTRPPERDCSRLTCAGCDLDPECSFCASGGGCQEASAACAFPGTGCDDGVQPCSAGRCWRPDAELAACGMWNIDEDFSSGRFDVHQFELTMPGGGPVVFRLVRNSGSFAPAIWITRQDGSPVWLGDGGLDPDIRVTEATAGRGGMVSEVTLQSDVAVPLFAHITGWATVDSGFETGPGTDVTYSFSIMQMCAPPEPGASAYGGISRDGNEIPREGIANGTLERTLGVAVEPHGRVVTVAGQQWVRGTISHFGGPDDTGVSATETGAITGENLRSLNNPLDPSAADLASRPEDYYYVAMRYNYSPGGRDFWRANNLVIRNPSTGVEVVVRNVDWGPHTRTNRILDISPQSERDLGLITDDEADVAFARPGTPLGPVR